MRLTNVTGLPATWTMGFQRDGREMLIVMVKASYSIPRHGEQPELLSDQQPLVEADQFTGEPGLSAPLRETDFAHGKPRCDVVLIGSAHAPQGTSVTQLQVGMRVGGLTKQFNVNGPRVWRKQVWGVSASEAQPFHQLPISYDVAFGGTDRTHEKTGQTDTYERNPVGKGYWRHTDHIDGQLLPYTEQIGEAVSDHQGVYQPMSFSPVGRNWLPRRQLAGTYDQHWIENTAPLWPADFDQRYFQCAPEDQQMAYPQGGEEVILRNLTPDGLRAFRLPARTMPVTFIPHKGSDAQRHGVIDTLVLEPDADRFTLTWRVVLPLGSSLFDVKEMVLGEMSHAWHRARRFPHKTYYPSLADAVRANPRGRGRP
ncbi:MAG: DUF2169 domain-containing protein [Aquabacterium sp.]|nr:DUF2169 domain-containing protein [Aquabacterium sp.]